MHIRSSPIWQWVKFLQDWGVDGVLVRTRGQCQRGGVPWGVKGRPRAIHRGRLDDDMESKGGSYVQRS